MASLDDTDWSQLVPAIKEQSGQIDGKVDELMEALGCAKDKPCD